MTNNNVLKKLRIALKLRDEDIIEILKLVDFQVPKSEIMPCSEPKAILISRNVATNCSGIS
jgi:uncharacterized protein YehS (DUF1456 family)